MNTSAEDTFAALGGKLTGAELLGRVHVALTKYVVMPSPEATDATALWIVASHAQPAWEHATRLVITAPEKRCGKSRLLDVIEATCHKPLITVNISPAALVRSIGEKDPPTLLLDEADTIFGRKAADNHEDLRGIVNSGHQRNRPYIRWDATSRQREDCPTFAMAALAGIGDLPDTIMDRAVIIRMRRRAPGELVEPYRTRRDRPPLEAIRGQAASWARAHRAELVHLAPDLPVEDRAADNWEPLVVIADVAGGDWPARARKAAVLLCAEDADADTDASLGLRLLADVRDIFGDLTVSFLPSADLTARLRSASEAPWQGLDLSMHKLAFLLKPYGVRPRQNDARTARGYHLADLIDPFRRYLTVQTVQPSAQPADQREHPDTSLDTPLLGNCPDTSAEADCPPNCPPISAGQDGSADGWTVADTTPPESWLEDTIGADEACR
jgi:hypothetical protein